MVEENQEKAKVNEPVSTTEEVKSEPVSKPEVQPMDEDLGEVVSISVNEYEELKDEISSLKSQVSDLREKMKNISHKIKFFG